MKEARPMPVPPVAGEPLRALGLAQDLIRIDTSRRNTEPLLQYVEQLVSEHGRNGLNTMRLPIGKDQPGNDTLLIGKNLSTMPRVLAVVHVDTHDLWDENDKRMYDPLGGTVVDRRLYGRGSGDAKGPAGAMLEAFFAVQDQMPDGVVLALTSDEEKDLGGAYAVRRYYENIQKRDALTHPILVFSANGSTNEVGVGSRGAAEGYLIGKGFSSQHTKNLPSSMGLADPVTAGIRHLITVVDTEMEQHPILGSATAFLVSQETGIWDSATHSITKNSLNNTPDTTKQGLGMRLNGMPLRGEDMSADLIARIAIEGVEGHTGIKTSLSEQGLVAVEFHPTLVTDGIYVDPQEMGGVFQAVSEVTGKTPTEPDYPNRGLDEATILTSLKPKYFAILGPGNPATFHTYEPPGEWANIDAIEGYVDVFKRLFTLQI